MSEKKYRVIGWANGHVRRAVIRGIIDHRSLDLVGLFVHIQSKEGSQARELAVVDPIKASATRDIDRLLELGADCVCYTATDNNRGGEVIDELFWILCSGTNIVPSSYTQLVHPAALVPEVAKKPEAARAGGGSSLHVSGINPGFRLAALPAVLTSLSQRGESIDMYQNFGCSEYDDKIMMSALGFGLTPSHCQESLPVVLAANKRLFSSVPSLIAHSLGLEVDDWKVTTEERSYTDNAVDSTARPSLQGQSRASIPSSRPRQVESRRSRTTICALSRPKATGGPPSVRPRQLRSVATGSRSRECPPCSSNGVFCTGLRLVNCVPFVSTRLQAPICSSTRSGPVGELGTRARAAGLAAAGPNHHHRHRRSDHHRSRGSAVTERIQRISGGCNGVSVDPVGRSVIW